MLSSHSENVLTLLFSVKIYDLTLEKAGEDFGPFSNQVVTKLEQVSYQLFWVNRKLGDGKLCPQRRNRCSFYSFAFRDFLVHKDLQLIMFVAGHVYETPGGAPERNQNDRLCQRCHRVRSWNDHRTSFPPRCPQRCSDKKNNAFKSSQTWILQVGFRTKVEYFYTFLLLEIVDQRDTL